MRNCYLLSLIFIFLFSCDNSGKNGASIKNVVVIVADDHALKVTGAYGNKVIHSPNIDKLAEEGVLFTHAYCNSPICSASRQSLLTGKYPHATGVNLLFTPFPDEGNTTIAEHLQNLGYKTALIGKTHFNNWFWASLYKNGLPDHGFETIVENNEYQQFLRQNSSPLIPDSIKTYNRENIPDGNIAEWMNCYNLPHPVYDEYSSGTFYAKQAAGFIAENKEQPFFLWTAFFQPHHPYYYPVEFAGKYKPEDMPLPEGSQEDDRWIPAKFRTLTDDQKRGIIAAYYTSTEYLDKNIGIILDALMDNGLEDNTLVVYLSDNGYLLNDHKRFEKHTMWEEATHQPLIIKAGRTFEKGSTRNALVEYIDVAPTILDILNLDPLTEVQGSSFLPVLLDEENKHKEFVFAEYLEDNLAMVCNRNWKYMFTSGSRDLGIGYATGYGPSGIVHRLYNLKEDPLEKHDLSANYPEIVLKMQQIMLQRFMETHPDAANCPEGLTVEGKLVWFCEPRDVGTDQSAGDVPVRIFKH